MSSGNDIRILPIHVANKIAAGEVVDRPASIVKELVENSIDSGAHQVDVAITAGGRKLVSVNDDGGGMSRDNALLSVERHATSKISDVDDIEKIDTLGFRGEALAAIASVSRFRLLTCRRDEDAGTEISIVGGTIQDVNDAGCPPGTLIEVRDLFFNVPARRKFLRSHQTELGHLRDTFIVEALAHTRVGMSLNVDGRDTYRLPATDQITDRIRELFGPDLLAQLRPVDHTANGVTVTGLVSIPTHHRSDRNEQYLFINNRPTAPALLNFAIREGYHGLLPKGRNPTVFLFLAMNPGGVDVNVHPTKKEIRFRRPGDVRDAVIEAIRAALTIGEREDDRMSDAGGIGIIENLPPVEQHLHIEDMPTAHVFKYPRMPQEQGGPIPPHGDPPHAEAPGKQADAPPHPEPNTPWTWCRVVGQIAEYYVVLETEEGMALMDPRAAHERVLFDRFMTSFLSEEVALQPLLIPETVEMSPRDAVRIRKHEAILRKMGFGISEFGGNSFVVDAVPALLDGSPIPQLLVDLSQSIEQAGARGGEHWREDAMIQAACQTAVRSRKKLTLQEIERLVVDLAGCEMPYTSPRGRPTLTFTSVQELNRKFGRTS